MIPERIELDPNNIWTLGEKLKAVREERFIKQKDLADALGSPQSMISLLEANVKIPTLYTLINYCDCIGYDIVLVNRI